MGHCEFEGSFKGECILEIIQIIRSGNVGRAERMQIAQHVACFIGSGAKLLEEQSPPEPMKSIPMEWASIANSLEEHVGGERAHGVPWLEILKILLPLLIDLFSEDEQ